MLQKNRAVIHKIRWVFVFTGILFVCFIPRQSNLYENAGEQLSDTSAAVLYIPIENVKSQVKNNYTSEKHVEFKDLFIREVVNGLVPYELTKYFHVARTLDSFAIWKDMLDNRPNWSILRGDTGSPKRTAAWVRDIAKTWSVDLIVIPYACHVYHDVKIPKVWKTCSYSFLSYERPMEYSVQSFFHIQIWTKDGVLIFERIGKGCTKHPVHYSLMQQDTTKTISIEKCTQRFFGSQLVKSLEDAVADALTIREKMEE